ncbi:hypothetical protein SAMN05421823_102539 [Catalinimonas alkaloidigena]|uniref:Concanavalin A-like lectin/glucanases superfamily protein n=1 Tax=Catalinimonas alkaloidigena TaxID=1075417 RepID=A0A1G9B7J8_9BACT|nr:hypothetical protein [Catalinimonas alkaloidigena]SDK35522.1 hypothetical protein SAMN05421823_102539 [Catalinimonas alkaloidigena]
MIPAHHFIASLGKAPDPLASLVTYWDETCEVSAAAGDTRWFSKGSDASASTGYRWLFAGLTPSFATGTGLYFDGTSTFARLQAVTGPGAGSFTSLDGLWTHASGFTVVAVVMDQSTANVAPLLARASGTANPANFRVGYSAAAGYSLRFDSGNLSTISNTRWYQASEFMQNGGAFKLNGYRYLFSTGNNGADSVRFYQNGVLGTTAINYQNGSPTAIAGGGGGLYLGCQVEPSSNKIFKGYLKFLGLAYGLTDAKFNQLQAYLLQRYSLS